MDVDSEFFTPLDLAVHATVKEYVDPRTGKRGAVALAARLDMPSGTLSNKANPTMPEAKLGLRESAQLQLVADNFRILYAYNAELGHCAYQLPLAPKGSDVEILDAYLNVQHVAGSKASAIRRALMDGRVTPEEMDGIKMLFDQQVRATLELLACLQRLAP